MYSSKNALRVSIQIHDRQFQREWKFVMPSVRPKFGLLNLNVDCVHLCHESVEQ